MASNRTRLARRRFLQWSFALAEIGLLSGCAVPPLPGQNRPTLRRIGYLSTNPPTDPYIEPLRQGLRELGWVEGQNLAIDVRYSDGKPERLPALADELVQLKVELIHAAGLVPAKAARQVTTTIPIVTATAGDPVGDGLAASLSHPGGNVTGMTSTSPGLIAKRVELLTEVVPGTTRLGVLKNSTYRDSPTYDGLLSGVEAAAQTYHLQLQWAAITRPDPRELEQALGELMRERPDAMIVISDPVTLNLAAAIATLALQHRLPVMAGSPDSARTGIGLLVGYGASQEDLYRRSAGHVNKILRGANPAELPIEQPSLFDFVINLKTAQALGLTIPPLVLQQATEVIR